MSVILDISNTLAISPDKTTENHQLMKYIISLILFISSYQVFASATWFEVKATKEPVFRTFQGQIEAIQRATVSAQTSGRVAKIHVDVDDFVTAGTVLIEFTNEEQKQTVEQAQANLEAARATEKQALANFKRARDIYQKKLISQSEYDRAESQKNTAVAAVKTRQAALESAQTQLEYTLVKAPFDGIVTARHVEQSETVNIGTALMSGLSLDNLRVVTQIPESMANLINVQGHANIELPDGSRVESTDLTLFPYADPGSKTFALRVNLPPTTPGLFPGMSLKVHINIGQQNVLMIPNQAIIHRGELSLVYVRHGHEILPRQIRTGQKNDEMTTVISGLASGDFIAIDPLNSRTNSHQPSPH